MIPRLSPPPYVGLLMHGVVSSNVASPVSMESRHYFFSCQIDRDTMCLHELAGSARRLAVTNLEGGPLEDQLYGEHN
jgi:hypothetical protein